MIDIITLESLETKLNLLTLRVVGCSLKNRIGMVQQSGFMENKIELVFILANYPDLLLHLYY